MRDLRVLDAYRLPMSDRILAAMGCTDRAADLDLSRNGAFAIGALRIIAAAGGGWDHVSVSVADRCPTWAEMETVAKMFFADDEVAMQLHVPAKDHINNHPFVLHWWRPRSSLKPIPLPPKRYV